MPDTHHKLRPLTNLFLAAATVSTFTMMLAVVTLPDRLTEYLAPENSSSLYTTMACAGMAMAFIALAQRHEDRRRGRPTQ